MEDYFGVSYKLSKSENFDDYMKVLGVGMILRKTANAMSPVVTLSKGTEGYVLTTQTTFKNTELKFKTDEEFEEETMDGRKVMTVMKMEGNKLVQTQKDKDGKVVSVITREFDPNQMKTTLTAGDVVCTRYYDRVQK